MVVASWVTQKWTGKANRKGTEPDGNILGVDEESLLKKVKTYIFIGNEAIHKNKRILSKKHVAYAFPWIVSRASQPELDIICEWNVSRSAR